MKQTEKAYKSPQDQKSKPRLNASAKESAESNSKKDLHALTNSELRYRRLFEAAQDGILILDAETGTITDVNPFLIEMLGYSHEEFMEKKLWDVGAFNDIGVSRDGFRKLQENEYIRYEDLPLKAKDGRLVRVEFVSNVYLVGDKKVIQCNIRDITEHKQAEKALQESNEILRALVNSSPLAIIALDPDGHVTQWNPAAERMFGWKESEVLGNFLPIVSEDKRNENRALRERVLLGEGFTDVQARRRKKDGSPIDISISTAPIHDSQGQVIGIISVSADITERKKAEQLLEERDVLLNEVGAIAKIGGWEMDMATGKATWSKGTYDIVEIDYDKPIPGLYEHIGYYLPEYRKMVEKKMKALIETRQPMQFEVALKTQKGNSKWCQAFGEAVVKDGELIKLRGTFQDITERKRAEQALAESETKFRWLYEYAPSAYHLLTSEGIITDVNRRWCELLGYCREEVIGKSIFDFVIEEEKEEAKASFEKKKQSGQSYVEGSERGFVTKDGAVRTFKTYDFFVMDQNQNLTSVQTTIEDITEHKRADEALKHSESSLAEAQKLTHIGSAEVDIQTDACIFSDEHFRIWGYEPGEMKPSYNFLVNSIHPDDRGEFIQRLQDTIEGQKPLEMEARVIRPDGSIRFVYFRTDVHRNPEGKAGRLMGTAQDITERRQAEKILIDRETRLTEAQRIAHLGNWDWDIENDRAQCSDETYRIFGFSPEKDRWCYELFINAVHTEDRESVIQASKEALYGKNPFSMDFRIVRPDSSERIVHGNAEASVDANGKPIHMVGTVLDITELKRAEKEIQSRSNELSSLYKFSRSLAEINDLNKIIEMVNQGAVESIRLTFAQVALLEGNELVLRAAYSVRVPKHSIPVNSRVPLSVLPHCQRALENNEPVILSASDQEFCGEERTALQVDFVKSLCLIPLRVGDSPKNSNSIIGLLILGEARSILRQPFTNETIRLARSIGDQAAIAIHRAQLHEQTERRLQHLAALREIDKIIISSFDLRLNLTKVLTHVVQQTGVAAADVLLFNPNSQIMEYAAGLGFRTNNIEKVRLRLGEGYAGRAALENQMIRVLDLSDEHDLFLRRPLLASEEFVSYFGMPLEVKGQVKGVLEVFQREPYYPDEEWIDFLNALAGQAAIAIDNSTLFNSLQRSNSELTMAYNATIEGWSHALDLRDNETEGHTLRVADRTVKLAQSFDFSENDILQIRWGALLHDIGKMGVPDGILFKPGALTDKEWLIMKKHPTFAYEMLSPIRYLRLALDIPYCHHEKWDGTGYPRGLKGEQIPLNARIFAVVDVWDALRSTRPYRDAWPEEKVRKHIKSLAGTHFDPQIVDACFKLHVLEQ